MVLIFVFNIILAFKKFYGGLLYPPRFTPPPPPAHQSYLRHWIWKVILDIYKLRVPFDSLGYFENLSRVILHIHGGNIGLEKAEYDLF